MQNCIFTNKLNSNRANPKQFAVDLIILIQENDLKS